MRGMSIRAQRVYRPPVPPSAPALTIIGSTTSSISMQAISEPAPGQLIIAYTFESAPSQTGPWTQRQTGASSTFTHSGLTADTEYFYRAIAQQTDLQFSAYNSVRGERTQPAAGPADPDMLAGTEFTGVDAADTFIQSYGGPGDYTSGVERRLNGTDTASGTVFGASSPLILEATTTPRYQILARSNDGGRAYIAPEALFTASKVNLGGSIGNVFRVVQNQFQIFPDQYAYRHFPAAPRSRQGILCSELVLRWDPTWDFASDHSGVLIETKFNAVEEKIELAWTRESGNCWLRLNIVRGNSGNSANWGATNLWGFNSGGSTILTRTVTPTPDSAYVPPDGIQSIVFSKGIGAADPTGAAPTPGAFMRFVLAHRWEDPAGNVAGDAAEGWVAAWSSIGTTTSLPVRGTEQLRFFAKGYNLHSSVGNGADIHFPMNRYTAGGIGKAMDFKMWYVYRALPSWLANKPVDAV